jgi:hypothetical protein
MPSADTAKPLGKADTAKLNGKATVLSQLAELNG